MAKLYNISNWSEQTWLNTGGTRDKKIYLNPEDGQLYYFKQSFKKGTRDFKHEFWSEIIASEIGNMLGFKLLNYDIAIRGEIVGCISKSMINPESEELVEGGKYLQAFDTTFDPANIKLRSQYNFNLIMKALEAFNKQKHIIELIETLVFDAVIGNSDRHQENWALIIQHTKITNSFFQIEKVFRTGGFELLPKWLKKIFIVIFTKNGDIRPSFNISKFMFQKESKFAPIYDSGCSFGRELDNARVNNMLRDESEIEKYVEKGLAEIHWENQKINHFKLLEKLLEMPKLNNQLLKIIERTISNFALDEAKNRLNNIDRELVMIGNPNLFPNDRKELVMKLLILRINKLKGVFSLYK